MAATKQGEGRVGSVDLLKFLLAVAIVIFHAGETFGDEDALLPMGGIAVEAFFVISGCLMCASAERDAERSEEPLGVDTARFLWKKVKAILVPYCVMVPIYLVCWFLTTGRDLMLEEGKKALLLRLLDALPNAMLVYMAGIEQDQNLFNIVWYISAMLIAMLVIYPLLRHFGRTYTLVIAPATSLFLMGFMYNTADVYRGITNFLVFMPQGLMRAFIAVNLGCVAWELSEKLKSLDLTRLSRVLLSVASVFLFLILVFVMQFGESESCYPMTLLMPVFIGILFSRQAAGAGVFDNAVSSYLGKASSYIYLYHTAVRRILVAAEADVTYTQAGCIMFFGAFAMFVVTDLLERLAKRIRANSGFRVSSLFVRAQES